VFTICCESWFIPPVGKLFSPPPHQYLSRPLREPLLREGTGFGWCGEEADFLCSLRSFQLTCFCEFKGFTNFFACAGMIDMFGKHVRQICPASKDPLRLRSSVRFFGDVDENAIQHVAYCLKRVLLLGLKVIRHAFHSMGFGSPKLG